MDKLFTASSYLRHRLLGTKLHGVHSPFAFDLFYKIIKDETPYYFYDDIESLRSNLLLNNKLIEVNDHGTGGKISRSRKLKISHIAKNFVQPRRKARLLSRLVTHFKPVNILELGTSLGLSTLYMALANKSNRVITIEGCPQTAAIALENFKKLGAKNIELINAEFDTGIPKALDKFDVLDLVYFDGNHTEEATLKYFHECLSRHHPQSLFIFDDIYWSRGMNNAWKKIIAHEEVKISVDLFHTGLIFFRQGIPKQHFNLKF
ncbi:MAG TPA: class I SAM-dependent methyltransferase [Bacteroidia bacterium]|nr:class I SAM-dependent methyltransferase [Bacteroidia bacterium]